MSFADDPEIRRRYLAHGSASRRDIDKMADRLGVIIQHLRLLDVMAA